MTEPTTPVETPQPVEASQPADTTSSVVDIHPAAAAVLQWFEHAHLPKHLQDIVAPIEKLAAEMATSGTGPEVTAGLRKLLEAKDCFVRAAIELKQQS